MAKTKKRLLELYIQEVHTHGVQNVSLLSLSKAAKMSFGAIHYHFGKKDLFLEAIEYSNNYIRDFVTQSLEKKKSGSSLDRYFEINFEWIKKWPAHGSFWLYFIYEAGRSKKYAKLNQNYSQKSTERIFELLKQECPPSGSSESSKHLYALAEKIFQLILGSMAFSFSHSFDRERILKNCLEIKNSLIEAHLKE